MPRSRLCNRAITPADYETKILKFCSLAASTGVAAQPELGGLVINDNIAGSYDLDPALFFAVGHSYQNRVIRSDVTGTAIFAPRLRDPFNVTISEFVIDSFSIDGYAGWQTDVSYRTDGLGDRGPTSAERSAERSADGDVLTFSFGFPFVLDNLLPGVQEESLLLSILTDAPDFVNTGVATIFGRSLDNPSVVLSATIDGIAVPSAAGMALPVPGLLLLAGLTTGMAAGMGRSTRRR